MDLHLIFLGTAGATPTVDRGSSALLLIRGSERILIDCGEGTQRQLMRSAGLARIGIILITHLHGDHYLGLPGLLKTLSLLGREEPLLLYGPEGLYDLLRDAERLVGRPKFPLLVEEATPGVVLEACDYSLKAAPVAHGLPGLAWCLDENPRPGLFHPEIALELGVTAGPDFGRLQRGEAIVTAHGREVRPEEVMETQRMGRKVVVTGDTRPADTVIELAKGASVLVHESTFAWEERARALETCHCTAREAAEVARAAHVGLLALTHLSSRHSWHELRDEARAVFPQTIVPRDFDTLMVPYPEKGLARLVA
ncbi:MAG TPA: ribonuclease Z [Thermoleophilia bacterium]|nr:ribonuclease Z [Thermoleophilia bacterium]